MFNLDRKEANFIKNYNRLFGMGLPHMDAVEDVFRELKDVELEKLKATLVATLIEQRVFHKFKFLGKSFNIAIDGTGVVSFDYCHCSNCLHKISKNGKATYFHNVLEAKLVTSNGFSVSLASEWIENDAERGYEKQDSEHKAFKRLAAKLKKYFPRLPIVITADGLYPNKPFFDICRENNWGFIVTFKDGNLSSVWEEVNLLPKTATNTTEKTEADKTTVTQLVYRWENDIEYKGHKLNFIECKETVTNILTRETKEHRFAYLSSVAINRSNADKTVKNGRMRWKIENEGFNTQKNNGYNMQHKYSRKSFLALKNYYQTLQIAHMINQLAVLSQDVQDIFSHDGKLTVTFLWKRMLCFLIDGELLENELKALVAKRFQIRLRAKPV